MAEAFVLPCLQKIGETVLGKVGDCLVAPIQRQFKYMCCFDSNVTELEAQLEMFQRTREGVQLGVDDDRANVRVIDPNVDAWLKTANEVTREVERINQEKPKIKEGCLNGWCPNLKLRYSLSRKAVKNTEVVVKLQATGVSYTKTSYSPATTSMETIPNGHFKGFESRRLAMEEIINALKHDGINLIGVCGMGGAGKTTMVNEVAKRAKEDAGQKKKKAEEDDHFDEVAMAKVNEVAKSAKEDNHFDEVAMAIVGQEPNLTAVQACIADMLGLKLGDRDNPIVRADLLRNRLLQDNKKILVILDDIWAEFDLLRMGIPLGRDNKNLKVLYTSRIQDLWHDRQAKKEIHLELLLEDEAWQLFKEKVGDSADAPDLQSIAKQIVKECGRLPLVLVLIGSALSKTKGNHIKETWKDMLYRLKCSSINKNLSELLETSYKYLEDEEAKRLFLLCCLFKDDESIRIEDLVRYAFGLSILDGIYEITRARDRVVTLVDDLKSRYLLQESKDINYLGECVKVHDVVRNMGISIASRDEGALVSHGALPKWPRKDTYEHYTSISVILEKITELPEGLTCSNLELLLLQCRNLEKLPCHFFEGMGKLKVLVIKDFQGILTFQPLKNLTALSLEGFCGMLDNVRVIGDLQNLEILSFRNSKIRELPEEIGELKKLKSLDLEGTYSLNRIPRGVMSRLVSLEELYAMRSSFDKWVEEGEENANLREFESLSSLNTLEIYISGDMPIPRAPIFGELKMYKVFVGCAFEEFTWLEPYKRLLSVVSLSIPIASDPFISLLRDSDCIVLRGKGCNDLVRELLLRDEDDGLQQLKGLGIYRCDTPASLANTINLFPILKYLFLGSLSCLREICRSPVPMGSFRELTKLGVSNCGLLENLFEPIEGCFAQLKDLTIRSCIMMKEVFSKQQREDVHDATKRIEFPNLETLKLEGLPSLVGFCGGIDQIDFPKLKHIRVVGCGLLENLFELPIGGCFAQLEILTIESCIMMKEVFWKQQREDVPDAIKRIEFPKLETLNLEGLPSLVRFCGGIDQIDFPKLECMHLESLAKLKRLFNNSNLPSNSEQKDSFSFLSLFPQKVSLPNLKVLNISELECLETLGHDALAKLEEFSVRNCGKLLCVFPSQFVPMLRNLERLTVESCHLLEVVFELERVDTKEPNPEILSALKVVELLDLPKLIYISKGDPNGFKYVQTLEIVGCHSLRYVFAPTVTKSITQLRELKIWRCEMLSRIVAEENGIGESSVDEVKFPRLEKLELCYLPNLVSFFLNVNTALPESTDRLRNAMQPQSLFNEKVAIPSLKLLKLLGLENVNDLWCSDLSSNSFSKLEKLRVSNCASLRNIFHPSMAEGLVNLKKLLIDDCLTLEAVVGKEEEVGGGRGSRKIDKTLFPRLEELQLCSLPNLRRYCHFSHPLELALLSKMVIWFCPSMEAFSSGHVSTPNLSSSSLWWYGGMNAIQLLQENEDDPMTRSMEKPRILDDVTDISKPWQVAVTQCPTVAVPDNTDGLHKVARLLYTNSGDAILALGCNGIMRMWKWGWSKHNMSGEATARVVPQQWQPASGLAMMNDVTGAILEEAVPCIALSKNDSYVISACGGVISLFNMKTFKVMTTLMPPPPASTYLAFYPNQDNNVIAVGMEDSTIYIYNVRFDEVQHILKGHQKCITSLAFSTNLNMLVSSGADAQTWENSKSVPIHLQTGKAHDTRVQFHSDQIHLLVSHETQLAIYDASKMDRVCQWVPQDVLLAPISFAAYSCDSQLVYASFCDGNIGVFDANCLTLRCRIAPSTYMSPALLSGSHAVYALVVAAHPQEPNQFAIGLTDGSVIVMEAPRITGLDGGTASSSNACNQTLDKVQN